MGRPLKMQSDPSGIITRIWSRLVPIVPRATLPVSLPLRQSMLP
jgi:hypothetical protein